MPSEFFPLGVTVQCLDLSACRHPVLYSETHPRSTCQVPKQARLRTNSEVSMWACSKFAHFFVITDCHTACISIRQDHLFSAFRHNSVSSAMARRGMCAWVVVIAFRCKTQHWHYCGCEPPISMFSCEAKGTNKCPVSAGPCKPGRIPCVTQLCLHHISGLKLKQVINSERLYTSTDLITICIFYLII